MNEQEKLERYKAYCNLCLIDLLIFSKNIEKELKDFEQIIITPEFIETYRNIIVFIKNLILIQTKHTKI